MQKTDEEYYNEARELVMKRQKASTSFIHQHLKISYPAAAFVIEKLVEEGVVSEPDVLGKRKVLQVPTQTLYSSQDDWFTETDIMEVYRNAIDQEIITITDDPEDEQILEIYSADFKTYNASRYFPDLEEMIDSVSNCAYDEVGEFSFDWVRDLSSSEHRHVLAEALKNIIDAWALKHNLQPTFAECQGLNASIFVKPISEDEYRVVDKPTEGVS